VLLYPFPDPNLIVYTFILANGQRRIEDLIAINPDRFGLHGASHAMRLAYVLGPDMAPARPYPVWFICVATWSGSSKGIAQTTGCRHSSVL
jgi:hypothetical protein